MPERRKKQREELGSKAIGPLLLKQAMPATIGMMFNSLYNLVDAIYIGQGAGHMALAGLAIAFPIQMVVLALSTAVGIGGASILSRALGSGDEEKAHIAGAHVFGLVLIIGILVTILGSIFLDPLLKLFGATPGILPYARDYMSIIVMGMIFYLFVVASNNVVRAEGAAKMAMVVMALGTGLNIFIDPIFIFDFKVFGIQVGLGMGIAGAALATVVSLAIASVALIHFYASGKSTMQFKPHHFKIKLPMVLEIFKIGASSLSRMVGGSILAIVLNNSVGHYGKDIHLAIVGGMNRIIMFLFLPLIGLVQGFLPIVGYNYGAKKMDRVKHVLSLSIKIATVYSFFVWGILMLFAEPLLAMFGSDPVFINEGGAIMRKATMVYLLLGFQLMGAALFQGIGKAGPALLLSSSRQILFLVPLIILLPNFFGLDGIWYAHPIADSLATIVTFIWVMKERKSLQTFHDASGGGLAE
jgi:putative MATE family efflux protein